MAQFALLLHETPSSFANISPEEMQGIIERYVAWRQKVEADGRMAGGHKLTEEGGRHLSKAGGQLRVVDGPYAEAKEVLGGLFVIEAVDYDDAIQVSSDCPHLDFGWIELRQVDPVGADPSA